MGDVAAQTKTATSRLTTGTGLDWLLTLRVSPDENLTILEEERRLTMWVADRQNSAEGRHNDKFSHGPYRCDAVYVFSKTVDKKSLGCAKIGTRYDSEEVYERVDGSDGAHDA